MVQPNYLPWRGYFDFIASVDMFVFYDDVALGNGKKWRNRNRIRTKSGTTWLTVPIRGGQGDVRLRDVRIASERDWQARHLGLLRDAYSRTRFPEYLERLEAIVAAPCSRLVDLDLELSCWLMSELSIDTPTCRASAIGEPDGDKWHRPFRDSGAHRRDRIRHRADRRGLHGRNRVRAARHPAGGQDLRLRALRAAMAWLRR